MKKRLIARCVFCADQHVEDQTALNELNLGLIPPGWIKITYPEPSPQMANLLSKRDSFFFVCPKKRCRSVKKIFGSGMQKPSPDYLPLTADLTYRCSGCREEFVQRLHPLDSFGNGTYPTGWMAVQVFFSHGKGGTAVFCTSCVAKVAEIFPDKGEFFLQKKS